MLNSFDFPLDINFNQICVTPYNFLFNVMFRNIFFQVIRNIFRIQQRFYFQNTKYIISDVKNALGEME